MTYGINEHSEAMTEIAYLDANFLSIHGNRKQIEAERN